MKARASMPSDLLDHQAAIVRFVGVVTLYARLARPAGAADLVIPRPIGMAPAHPADAKADVAFAVHAGKLERAFGVSRDALAPRIWKTRSSCRRSES